MCDTLNVSFMFLVPCGLTVIVALQGLIFIIRLYEKMYSTEQSISYVYTSRKPMIRLGRRSCIMFSMSLVYP